MDWALPNVKQQNNQWNMGIADTIFDDYIENFRHCMINYQNNSSIEIPIPAIFYLITVRLAVLLILI